MMSKGFLGLLYVSGRLPTYPSHKPTSTLNSNLGQNVGLGEEYVGSFPETYNDPFFVTSEPGNVPSSHPGCVDFPQG